MTRRATATRDRVRRVRVALRTVRCGQITHLFPPAPCRDRELRDAMARRRAAATGRCPCGSEQGRHADDCPASDRRLRDLVQRHGCCA